MEVCLFLAVDVCVYECKGVNRLISGTGGISKYDAGF